MADTSDYRGVRTRLLGALAAAALLVAPAAAGARQHAHHPKAQAHGAASACENTDLMPTADNLPVIRAALLCLHNQIRAQHHLPLLKDNRRLRKAAVAHSENMVADGYFDHTEPSGATFVDRILAARYVSRDQGWALGENLAWGTGELATPAEIMNAWMHSPGHRANILRRAYRDVGIGVVTGVPSGDSDGATVTADFGVRR